MKIRAFPCTTCTLKHKQPDGFWTCEVHLVTVYNPEKAGCDSHSDFSNPEPNEEERP
jgi:hypothetical protein